MRQREADLIGHYDRHLDYYSPLRDLEAFKEICGALEVTPAAPVLDLGCGDGRLVKSLPDSSGYVGVDYSGNRISKACRENFGYRFERADVYDWLEDTPLRFLTIVAVELLEHLEQPRLLVDLALNALAPGGVMIATVPIGMPYEAHLQVFDSVNDVFDGLQPHTISTVGKHYAMAWRV